MSALDEILATIRRLPLPERLRLIERASLEAAEDTPKPAAVSERERRLSLDEFLAARLTAPPGVGPVSLQDMERAIAEGATGRGSLDTNVIVRPCVRDDDEQYERAELVFRRATAGAGAQIVPPSARSRVAL